MSCAASISMSNIFKASKMPSPSHVIEHGLLVGILLVLMNAAITLETLEVMTGVIGALAVYVMKENASKRPTSGAETDGHKDRKSGWKVASSLLNAEPAKQLSSADEVPARDADIVQLRACVQAELNAFRAECKLEHWKNKAEVAEAELTQLHFKIVELEKDLSQAQAVQLWTEEEEAPRTEFEALLGELTEAKLRVEEVEAELVQAQSNMADLENDVAQAASIRSGTENTALARIEASSSDLAYANDQLATDVVSAVRMVDDISEPLLGALCLSAGLS